MPETEALANCVLEVRQLLQKILSDVRPHDVLKNVDRMFVDNKGIVLLNIFSKNMFCFYIIIHFNIDSF